MALSHLITSNFHWWVHWSNLYSRQCFTTKHTVHADLWKSTYLIKTRSTSRPHISLVRIWEYHVETNVNQSKHCSISGSDIQNMTVSWICFIHQLTPPPTPSVYVDNTCIIFGFIYVLVFLWCLIYYRFQRYQLVTPVEIILIKTDVFNVLTVLLNKAIHFCKAKWETTSNLLVAILFSNKWSNLTEFY